MGVTELVASSVADYADIAVRVARDAAHRGALRERVLANMHKLFHQEAAVDAWTALLKQLAAPLTDGCKDEL